MSISALYSFFFFTSRKPLGTQTKFCGSVLEVPGFCEEISFVSTLEVPGLCEDISIDIGSTDGDVKAVIGVPVKLKFLDI